MREFLELGPCPPDETAADIGEPGFAEINRRECEAFIRAIRNYLGPEPEGARLTIKAFQHDFGTYRECVCYYDETKPESVEYAFRCEAKAPLTWAEGGIANPRHRGGQSR